MYDQAILEACEAISTPTITTLRINEGLHKIAMRGPVATGEVAEDPSPPGLYPPNAEARARDEATKK